MVLSKLEMVRNFRFLILICVMEYFLSKSWMCGIIASRFICKTWWWNSTKLVFSTLLLIDIMVYFTRWFLTFYDNWYSPVNNTIILDNFVSKNRYLIVSSVTAFEAVVHLSSINLSMYFFLSQYYIIVYNIKDFCLLVWHTKIINVVKH